MMNWAIFLADWSRQMMASRLSAQVDPPPESPEWLGYSPATQTDLKALEKRLGFILPPSYKAFLLMTDGWRRTTQFIGRIRPAAEVNWFHVENESWVETFSEHGMEWSDQDHYDYRKHDGSGHRAEHMRFLIQISDVEDGVYLLNPQAVTADGEWEAWFFANWIPGAQRYPSFAHLMLGEYRSFAKLEGAQISERELPALQMPAANVPRVPAERVPAQTAKAPGLDRLIEQLKSSDDKQRAKAVRMFFGKLKGRPRANRRPELIQPLTELFYTAQDADVRGACVAALTELSEDKPAPSPLLDALSDPNASVVLQGIFALHYFPDIRAIEPLCKFMESDAHVLFKESAMSQLGQMSDERAVPTLAKVLLNSSSTFDQSFATAGIALSRCGLRGFEVLMSALDHADARIRHAAVVGLDCSGDPRAAIHLDRMLDDPDSRVGERAKHRMGKPNW